ncbi:hypothetical protein IEO21_09487 [Rhodonia placenta]|uniref:Uncharacterized protein n=1 Tax=Rhodonia placenta TaxID=104341 RepID=A0A8H7NU79_9APHY|nr:hypothetical protein IEO21_09487 [Postia placenta]
MVDELLCPLSTAEKLGRLRRLQHMHCHTKLFLGNEEHEWTIDRTKINLRIEDLCVDASQDVLIVVGYSLTCDLTGHKPAMFHILSISQDGSPHPLAARSQIFLDNGQSKRAQIEGDLLALLITTVFRKRYGRIDVWDWKTGGCLWVRTLFHFFGPKLSHLNVRPCKPTWGTWALPLSTSSTTTIFMCCWTTQYTCLSCPQLSIIQALRPSSLWMTR